MSMGIGVRVVVSMVVAVRVGMCIKPFFAMKHQEIHTERIQRRDKHTDQGGVVRKASSPYIGSPCGFDDVFF